MIDLQERRVNKVSYNLMRHSKEMKIYDMVQMIVSTVTQTLRLTFLLSSQGLELQKENR